MIFTFKILFFTLISCCYLNTVFEFSDIEEKQNFQKESHCYIYQDILKLDLAQTTTQSKAAVVEFDFQPQIVHYYVIASKRTINNFEHKSLKPPQKRYILFASLLI